MNRIYTFAVLLAPLLFWGCSTNSETDEIDACRVYTDGDLALCVETNDIEVSASDCDTKAKRVDEAFQALMVFNLDEKPKSVTWKTTSSCPKNFEVSCLGPFQDTTYIDFIYLAKFKGYCSITVQ